MLRAGFEPGTYGLEVQHPANHSATQSSLPGYLKIFYLARATKVDCLVTFPKTHLVPVSIHFAQFKEIGNHILTGTFITENFDLVLILIFKFLAVLFVAVTFSYHFSVSLLALIILYNGFFTFNGFEQNQDGGRSESCRRFHIV